MRGRLKKDSRDFRDVEEESNAREQEDEVVLLASYGTFRVFDFFFFFFFLVSVSYLHDNHEIVAFS